MEYHVPVLLNECMEGLNIDPTGVYVDVTFGGGGHSREIMSRLGEDGVLVGFDQDVDAADNVIDDERFVFVNNNFRYIKNYLRYVGVDKVDGILADLGVSSHHFDTASRGFSFRFDDKLDMRMDQDLKMSAADILNKYSIEDLKRVFKEYGEIKNAGLLVKKIDDARNDSAIIMIGQLKDIAVSCCNKKQETKYLSQVFQALRIEVNQEMKVLEKFLLATLHVLRPGGRLVVITYHSLEDRMVKRFMKSGNLEGKVDKDFYGRVHTPFELINRKVIVPSDEELERNSRSRSAKLRIAELKG